MISTGEACTDAMMGVHHAGNSIEAEAVKLVLLHPKPQVTHQKAQDFMMAIVKQATVPELVAAFGSLMEILVVASIELVNTIEDVLACMRVNHIQKHCNSQSMCGINELLELLG
jgi:hypothetical protein